MVTLIDGKKISKEILDTVAADVAVLPFQPVFCDVLVGDDKPSVQYVGMKAKAATSVGMLFHAANFPVSITTEKLVEEIKKISEIPNMCGIILQLPLPAHIDLQTALDAVPAELDVDCLSTVSSKNFYEGKGAIAFPTALACMSALDSIKVDLSNKNIVVLGQGKLVGLPVTSLLKSRGLSPTPATNTTPNKEQIVKNADILISAIGQGKYITRDMLKEGVILIDAGTSEVGGGIVGDVDFDSVKDKASYIAPVPGGVGPITVAMLLRNVLDVAKRRI